MAKQKILLVDGSNHAFRLFHAMPRMSSGDQPTGALLGFANMLRQLETKHQPLAIVVAFDIGPSFRVEMHPDYKGHRPEMDPELRAQWPHFQTLIEAWGHTWIALENYEADDIMGTLALQWKAPDREIALVSGDKDLSQLVQPGIHILDLSKGRVYDRDGVTERLGIPPEQVVDWLALAGDSSDNVPGVSGIGPKTATKLLQTYGDLETLLSRAEEVKGKRGETLRAQKDQARLSKELVTLYTEIETGLDLETLQHKERDAETLRELFVRWQFRTHLRRLEDETQTAEKLDQSGYRVIRSREALAEVCDEIRRAGKLSLDLETTSLDPREASMVGFCLCWGPDSKQAAYVPVGHVQAREDADPSSEQGLGPLFGEVSSEGGDWVRCADQLSTEEAMELLQPLLADPELPKLGQNLKYDLEVLLCLGYQLAGIQADTMVQDYLLEPERRQHGLDDLCLRYLGHQPMSYEEVTAGLKKGEPFSRAPLDRAAHYGAEDAHVCWLLHDLMEPQLASKELDGVYRELELPLIPVLAEIEMNGMGVDAEALRGLSAEFGEQLEGLRTEIYASAGEEFKVDSTKELRRILFEKLGLTPVKKTSKGQLSTDAATLDQLRAEHPLPELLLRYRALRKLKSTYTDTLPLTISPVTGRIHTSLRQTVTATGRLSSQDPNLQNIPGRSEEGKRIRACFQAAPGRLLLSCDYSQIELRLMAHFCGEGALLEAFMEGQDIHTRTASEIFEIPLDEVSSAQRSQAKAVNFGILYGQGPHRLSQQLGISHGEAKSIIDRYFERSPEIRGALDRFIEEARETGEVRTLWGRRRPVLGIHARTHRERSEAERVAINTPVQGSAADLIKKAMVQVHQRLKTDYPETKLILQVHDELLFEVPEGEVETMAEAMRREMEGVYQLKVPLSVEAGWGRSWAEAH